MGVLKGKNSVGKCHFMFIGAHPDDADIESGGTAIKILDSGGEVTFVSMTNGDSGHQSMGGEALASRRRLESLAVSKLLGLDYVVLNNHDTELQPNLENRKALIELIRLMQPDIIATHRPNDYHADHRATSMLVQDASYLLSVPNVCPLVERLEYNPVILYHQDNFKKPLPSNPEIITDITSVFDRKIKSLSLHESQVYEWLPFIENFLDEVPENTEDRLEWLKTRWNNPGNVNQFLPLLKEIIGWEESKNIKYIEAFEISEYGAQLSKREILDLMPFAVINTG